MMVEIPANFYNSIENIKGICGEEENMAHICQFEAVINQTLNIKRFIMEAYTNKCSF